MTDKFVLPSQFSDIPVPDLDKLVGHFNPLAMDQLRRYKGYPDQYERHKSRFLAENIAWFASGCSSDGAHEVGGDDRFHKFYLNMLKCEHGPFDHDTRYALRDSVRDLTFDLATLWDRAFGGSTLILHVDGPNIPRSPFEPEYIKARVYLPPRTVVQGMPAAHPTLAKIVQAFIEDVGTATTQHWVTAARNHLRYKLTADGYPRPNPPPRNLIPNPVAPGSAHFIFEGRPRGALALYPSQPATVVPTRPNTPCAADGSYDASDYTASFLNALSLVETQADYDGKLAKAFEDFKEREAVYLNRIQLLEATIVELEGKVEHFHSGAPLSELHDAAVAVERIETPVRPRKAKRCSGQDTSCAQNATMQLEGMASQSGNESSRSQTLTATQHSQSGHAAAQADTNHSTPDAAVIPAIQAAQRLGYGPALTQFIRLLAQVCKPNFWAKELEQAGVHSEDVVTIVNAMISDDDFTFL